MESYLDSAAGSGIDADFSALSLNSIDDPDINKAVKLINSNLINQEQLGVKNLRSILSRLDNPPIKEIINCNIAPKLITMSFTRPKEFTYEVCWILCNIGSGDISCTKYLIDIQSLEFFDKIFDSDPNSFDLKDQITWAVGNVAGESSFYRDLVINSRVFSRILAYAEVLPITEDVKYQNLVWTFSNLSRGKPHPSIHVLIHLSRFMQRAILNCEKDNVLTDACWGLTYCSDVITEENHYSLQIYKRIIDLIGSNVYSISVPALRTLGNIISNNPNSLQYLIQLKALEKILVLAESPKKNIRKEFMWILSNICTESYLAVNHFKELKIYCFWINPSKVIKKWLFCKIINKQWKWHPFIYNLTF